MKNNLPALLLAAAGAVSAAAPARSAVAASPDPCAAFLTPDVMSRLAVQAKDPVALFEEHRRQVHSMAEMPPSVHCEHAAWMSLHGKPSPRPASTDEALAAPLIAAPSPTNIDDANGEPTYQGEVNLAINPNNPLLMVVGANSFYRDAGPGNSCVSPTGGTASTYGTQTLFGSTDGGQTWQYACAPWPASLTGGVKNANEWFGSDPAMAWDANGNAYAVYMLISANSRTNADGAAVVIAKSTNSGTSWSSLGTIVNDISNTSLFDDKEMVAIDTTSGQARSHTNRIYVIWDENNSERVAYSDNGTSWTTVVLSTGGDIGGNLAIGRDGTVYAVWNKYSTTGGVNQGDTTVFSRSTDGGATWSAAVQIGRNHNLASFCPTGSANCNPPAQDQRSINAFASVAVDTNPTSAFKDRIYVVYTALPAGNANGPDFNVYENVSTDGGATWSAEVKVNDDTGTTSQFFPWISVDQSDGTVNVSWYDTRANAASNTRTQIYYARSTDGGATFEPNILVTDGGGAFRNAVTYADENSADNTAYNGNQYGDYAGIAASNRQAHAVWTDSRNFYPSADTASPTRVEDVATATLTNCSAPSAPAAPSASCASGSMVVNWSAPSAWGTSATGGTYTVIRCTDSACTTPATLATGVTGTQYTDTSALAGTTYYYRVQATNNCPGTALTPMSTASASSAGASCISCPSVGAPAGVSASASCSGVTVSWTTVSGLSYDVVRGTACGTPVTTFAGVASPYTDATGVAGTTYQYWVVAHNACGNTSPNSACVAATKPATPAAPTGVVASSPADGQITLSWSSAFNASTYNVYRASGTCPGTFGAAVATGVTSPWTDTGVTPGGAYAYVVTGVSSGGCEGPQSSCVGASAKGAYSSGRFVSSRPQDTTTATQAARWIFNTPASSVTAPTVGGGVYTVSNDRMLHSMVPGQAPGTPSAGQWPSGWKPLVMNAPAQSRAGMVPLSSLISGHNRLVFASSQDGRVYAADGDTGTPVTQWGSGTGASAVLGDYLQSAVSGMFSAWGGSADYLFAATRNSAASNTMFVLNPTNGAISWQYPGAGGPSIGIISGDPYVDYTNKLVYFTSRQYVGGDQRTLWCVDLQTRSLKWAANAGGNVDGGVSVRNGVLYVGNNAGEVRTFEALSGAPGWTYATADGPVKGFVWTDWGTSNIYFSTNTKVWSLADGGGTATLNWSVNVPNPSAPLFVNGMVYVGGGDGALHEIAAGSTQKAATLGPGGSILVGAPSYDYASGMIYVGTDSGDVYSVTTPLP